MKRDITIMISMFLIFILILSGCSSSNIKYQPIEGTSEEFSKDVYDVLKGFEDDLKNESLDGVEFSNEQTIYIGGNISFINNSIALTFKHKYENIILNKKEQEIYNIVNGEINNVLSYLTYPKEIKYNDEIYKSTLKNGAENILQEIQK